ncbi:MAG: ABC transporter permease subunit [Oscillospiraceae bacterium]|jgi:putative aldouronate transport system permease protein|nr:ABC transporter permease subunit [Oscillospiraceae bacterium]
MTGDGAVRDGFRQSRGGGFHRRARWCARNYQLYVLLLPTLAYFVVFRYLPMVGVQLAFRDYFPPLGYWGSPWVGLKHVVRFFNSYYAKRIIINTLTLSFGTLILSFPVPILIALTLNEVHSKAVKRFAQTITYAPHFLSTVVVVGLLSSLTNQRYGIINTALLNMGVVNEPIAFMSSQQWFKPLYILSSIWQESGWNAVIYMAALSTVDVHLYEAARVDGAGRLKSILHITLPSIAPTMITLLILNCGKVMNIGYEKVLLMQNPLNIASSDVITTYVYQAGLRNGQYSYATAVGLFNSVINTVLILCVNTLSGKVSSTSLW